MKKAFAIFFWIFNVTLLLIVYVGYLPSLGPAIINDAIAGQVPLNFLLPFVGLVGVPTTCTVIGALPKQQQSTSPKRFTRSISLFQIFYGIEAPFLLLCLFRFFGLRDLNPVTTLVLLTGLVGTIAFTHWLFTASHPESNNSNWAHLVGHTLLLGIAIYLLTLAAFYVLPITLFSIVGSAYLVVFAVILFPLTILILGFFSMPWGMGRTYYRAWRQSFNQLSSRYGRSKTAALTAIVVVTWIGLFALVQPQPQIEAFKLLATPPQTEKARQELLQKSNLIRNGLLTAYLASYRYPRFQDDTIFEMYRWFLPESSARSLQEIYNFLVSPFTYKGADYDREKAAGLYAQFFDTPIIRAERPAIEKALQSTFMRNEAKAGLLDINKQRVLLAQQQITVKPQGDWADIEIYEVYQNQTYSQEEILYYFSLPETAVVTGVWLGENGDRSQSFPFTVSPRGAAQEVYNREVARRVDPALLEQVGPRNYRLRAFPIPQKDRGEMHLWLTYKVLKQNDNWPLPQLEERRNLYWNSATQRMINGKKVAAKDRWLPDSLPAKDGQPTLHQVALPENYLIQAKPFDAEYKLPQNQRFAVILDGSYSMNDHRSEVASTFRWLQEQVLKQNTADLYLTAAQGTPKRLDGLQGFKPDRAMFFGTLEHRQMLQQFQQLQGNKSYDAIILLTDAGSYELTENNKMVLKLSAPLWMVHLGGFPAAYDDATLQALQDSGGGVSSDMKTAMQRIGTQSSLGESAVNLADGYAWFINQNNNQAPQAVGGFTPIAARQWVTHLSRQMQPKNVKQLDAIHAVAKQYEIVTPYSSMIVLVNDRQREDLKRAEQRSDRFNREIEDQQLPKPSNLSVPTPVSAVPEPGEWLLILVSAIGLALVYYLRRSAQLN
ncbi:TIGR02921 family PEP-CTERM protein [Aerosakkonemataceae cyanobacterium BLCC-F154]|uniref:TIGR02921 family PEP-CTERM protein n=1 Tax=Floridaenema fluviatile BLCC-F154 TaxID=3153640 RepID=A0ABV4Y7P2_9CYAN